MSGTAIIRNQLISHTALVAAVPLARIFSGVVPLNTAMPAISVAQISGMQRLNVAMTGTRQAMHRVQVTAMALSYPGVKSILALVRTACANTSGVINTFSVDSILPDMEGPDIYDADLLIYFQSQDFLVKFSV